ncbi:hypothetical protein KKI17_02620 [Patescibacteria group bacterium]|nr:hypothetical protein [Patescibacteria group bacterium]
MTRRQKRKRGNKDRERKGIAYREFQAIQATVQSAEQQRINEGGNGQEGTEVRRTSISVSHSQNFSPKLAEVQDPNFPYFAVSAVRYLERCGLCDFPVTLEGRCINSGCLQDWGDPRKLTEELVFQMIEKAKALSQS